VYTHVDELIDPYTNRWDDGLIREFFMPLDAERIMRIPLSENIADDFVACTRINPTASLFCLLC
jgi:hypothetical protein